MRSSLTKIQLIIPSFLISLSACQNPDGSLATNDNSNSLDSEPTFSEKVYIDDATHEQIANFVFECHNGKSFCVEVCHRPPGNPRRSRDMILPLKATCAHLNHGGKKHADHDYLGPCHTEDADPDPIVGVDPVEATDPTESEDPNDVSKQPIEVVQDVPQWCLPYVEIDSNCDGFIDESGQPLF